MNKIWSSRNQYNCPTLEERFWEKVNIGKPEDCWEWLAGKNDDGYGNFVNKKAYKAHRMAWILTNGEIPDELCVCHKCDNRSCCNPSHLFLGTKAENSRDRNIKGRQAWGERNGPAKLSIKEVEEIRRLYATGHYSQRELAKIYGVNHNTIGSAYNRETWKRVE